MASRIQVFLAHRRYLPHFLVRAAVSRRSPLSYCASLQITAIIYLSAHGDGAPRGQAQGLNEHAQGLASVKPEGGGVEEVWEKGTGVDRSHRVSKQGGSRQREEWRNTDQGLTQVMMGVSTRHPRRGPPCPQTSHTYTS